MPRRRARSSVKGGWLWGLVLLIPLALLNLSISFFGNTRVFLLSPYFVTSKVKALGSYFLHRPLCSIQGHPSLLPLIADAERRHGLPSGLLRALIEVESGTQVHRISPAGAMGPGQLMPTTARMMGVHDPFEPGAAVDGSGRYLAEQLRRFGSITFAVAAYNAGPGSVRGRVPRNGETEFYVARVLKAYARYKPVVRRAPVRLVARKQQGKSVEPSALKRPPVRPERSRRVGH